jgi:hypothetical protein
MYYNNSFNLANICTVNVIQCIQTTQSCVGPLFFIDNILFVCLVVFNATSTIFQLYRGG